MSNTQSVDCNLSREERKLILTRIDRVAKQGAVALDEYTNHLASQLKVMSTM